MNEDTPFTVIEDDEIMVHYSGPMPDHLVNHDLPDLPGDTPCIDADIVVLTWGRPDLRIAVEKLAKMTHDEKHELLAKINAQLGIKPLTWSPHP